MTVSTAINKKSYAGDGATVAFPVPFLFLANSHVVALLRDSAGAEVTWVEGTQYSLTGAGNQSGGSLAVSASPVDYTPATGESLVITRVVPETQETDYPEGGVFPASAHEQALDKLTMAVQQHSEELGRALVVPVSDTAASLALPIDSVRASKFLSFDATGLPIAAAGTSANLGPVSSFINGLLDDADAATARTTLDAMQDVFTTRGDLLYEGAAGELRLAVGGSGQMLGSDGTDPAWQEVPLPRGALAGLGLSNNATTPNTHLDVAAGACRSAADATNIALAAITKRIDQTWAAGTNGGGLAAALTLTASTWYHVHALGGAGTPDVGFDTSIAATNLLADAAVAAANLTGYRRLGSVLTDGASAVLAFVQDGDLFQWQDPPLDVSVTNPGNLAALRALTVPAGVKLSARLNVVLESATTAARLYLSDPAVNDEAPSVSAAPLSVIYQDGATRLAWSGSERTNISQQIRSRVGGGDSSTVLSISTRGWQDRRGRDD